jgi:hypothetical protein
MSSALCRASSRLGDAAEAHHCPSTARRREGGIRSESERFLSTTGSAPCAKQALLRRRDFLALGSVAAGSALLPGLASAATQTPRGERLSVGYLEGSDRLENVFALPWRDLPPKERSTQWAIPAHSLVAGDSAMAYSLVTIKLHGLYPAMPSRGQASIADVLFTIYCDYPWLGLPEPLPFHAWGARFGAAATSGSPTRFVVPTRADGSLEMGFDMRSTPKRGGLDRRARTDFTVDSWSGRPKLQRGIYFLGFDSNSFELERTIPSDPNEAGWELSSLVMSVDHVQEGAI